MIASDPQGLRRGEGAQPPSHGFPRATFLRGPISGDSVSFVARLCFGLVSDLFSIGVCFVIYSLVREFKNGQVLGQNSWGRCFVLAVCQVLHFGGGSRGGGGSLEPSVPQSLDDSSRVQGGPWAPPPCNEHFPWIW